jgi:hypothetical protein
MVIGEGGNEPSGCSIKCGEFLDQQKTGLLLKKDSPAWHKLQCIELSSRQEGASGLLQVRVLLLFVCFGGGAYQHCSHEGLLYSHPNGVPSFISRGAAHPAARETSASEGRN